MYSSFYKRLYCTTNCILQFELYSIAYWAKMSKCLTYSFRNLPASFAIYCTLYCPMNYTLLYTPNWIIYWIHFFVCKLYNVLYTVLHTVIYIELYTKIKVPGEIYYLYSVYQTVQRSVKYNIGKLLCPVNCTTRSKWLAELIYSWGTTHSLPPVNCTSHYINTVLYFAVH